MHEFKAEYKENDCVVKVAGGDESKRTLYDIESRKIL